MKALPPEIRFRQIDGVNGLSMHALEAGTLGRPCVLLLHGFPEISYSWRKVMAPLAAAGFREYAGRTIDVPACFIAGSSDWGIHQRPGDLERMSGGACTDWRGTHLVPDAGHWVQQERPGEVCRLLLRFLREARG